jgi:hypothetical protein
LNATSPVHEPSTSVAADAAAPATPVKKNKPKSEWGRDPVGGSGQLHRGIGRCAHAGVIQLC